MNKTKLFLLGLCLGRVLFGDCAEMEYSCTVYDNRYTFTVSKAPALRLSVETPGKKECYEQLELLKKTRPSICNETLFLMCGKKEMQRFTVKPEKTSPSRNDVFEMPYSECIKRFRATNSNTNDGYTKEMKTLASVNANLRVGKFTVLGEASPSKKCDFSRLYSYPEYFNLGIGSSQSPYLIEDMMSLCDYVSEERKIYCNPYVSHSVSYTVDEEFVLQDFFVIHSWHSGTCVFPPLPPPSEPTS